MHIHLFNWIQVWNLENFPQYLRGLKCLRITSNPHRNRKQCTDITVQMHLHGKSSWPKLVQTLLPKNRYTLHYRLAQFYNSVGLKNTKLYRASKFEQANWMQSYMELNTSLRIDVSTAFVKKFYKGMNNSVFGKTCESKGNRDQVVIVRNAQSVLQRTQNFPFKSFKIFGESMAAMKIAKNGFIGTNLLL